jgi:hypothetical protein
MKLITFIKSTAIVATTGLVIYGSRNTILATAAKELTGYVVNQARTAINVAVNRLVTTVIGGPRTPTGGFRREFQNFRFEFVQASKNHSHSRLAGARSSFCLSAQKFAKRIGSIPYFVQLSSREQRTLEAGNRTFHWAKDLDLQPQFDEPRPRDLRVLVDDDYHLDVNHYLVTYGGNWLIWTIIPKSAGGRCYGATYSFKNNMLEMKVPGGEVYTHELWDWSPPTITVFDGWNLRVFKVEKRSFDYLHSAIFLEEVRSLTGFKAILCRFLIAPLPLKRFKPNKLITLVSGETCEVTAVEVVMDEHVNHKHKKKKNKNKQDKQRAAHDDFDLAEATNSRLYNPGYHVALAGHPHSHRFTHEELMAMRSYSLGTKIGRALTASGLAHFIRNPKKREGALALARIMFQSNIDFQPVFPVDYIPYVNQNFKPLDSCFDGETEMMQVIMPPFDPNDMSPYKCIENVEAGIEGRYIIPARRLDNDASYQTYDGDMYDHEFGAQMLLEIYNHGADFTSPLFDDELYDQLVKASQRNQWEDVSGFVNNANYKDPYRGFVKAESYGEVKWPRLINGAPTSSKFELSSYWKVIAELLKLLPFYGPGRSPPELAQMVVDVCQRANKILADDLSKFDGHNKKKAKTGYEIIFSYLVGRSTALYLVDQIITSYCNLRSGNDTRGMGEYGVRSGDPGTSCLGSIGNARIKYHCYRLSGLPAEQAWRKLCRSLVFGDDGLTPDPGHNHVRSAKRLGFVVTGDVISKGQFGVTFLSRYYSSDVWYGNVNSTADIPRVFKKFHLTSKQVLTARQKLRKIYQKCTSAMFSDANTPIYGEFARRYIERYDDTFSDSDLLKSGDPETWWELMYPDSGGFPNDEDTSVEIWNGYKWSDDYDFTRWYTWYDIPAHGADHMDLQSWVDRMPALCDRKPGDPSFDAHTESFPMFTDEMDQDQLDEINRFLTT